MFIENFNLSKKDYVPLVIIFLFSFGIILKLTEFHMSGGIFFPDKALYLISSLYYSGLDYYHIMDVNDLFFSPIISFLTSLLFRLGIVDQLAISFISSIFGFFGFFGLYIFLRTRFNPLSSLTGVIIYGSLSEVLLNLSSGLLDVPSISISIWVLIFAILAIDKNSKYFLIVFPLLVIGFFTKYTAGFILPLIFLYYAMQRNLILNIRYFFEDKELFKNKILTYFKSIEFKYLLVSCLFSLIILFIICRFLILDYGGSLTFLQQSVNTFNGQESIGSGTTFIQDKLYFIKNFSLILFHKDRLLDFTQSCILYGILFSGFLLNFFIIIKNKNKVYKTIKVNIKNNNFNFALFIIEILLVLFVLIFFKIFGNHMVTNICLLMALLILFYFVNMCDVNKNHLALNILNIGYFMVYLIFISIYPIKVTRYALPLVPPLIYLIIWSLNSLINYIRKNIGNNFKFDVSRIIPMILIGIFIISTFSFIGPIEIEKEPVDSIDHFINYKGSPNDLINITNFIIENDSDYHSKTFASYYHHYRMIKWYLNVNVTFINDDYKLIDESGTDYVILNENVSFRNYHEIYNSGDFYLYYKNSVSL